MILCIDTQCLKASESVQKDIDLEDLLLNHTKYYDTVAEALEDNYAPLNFSVTVRSIYDNTVMRKKNEQGNYLYYTNLTEIQPFVHKGYDLLMYLCSIGVLMNVKYSPTIDEVMMKHSQFQPIGILYDGTPYLDPIVYAHIIMSDEGMKLLEDQLNDGVEIVTIETMKEQSAGNIQALLNEIKEVHHEQ